MGERMKCSTHCHSDHEVGHSPLVGGIPSLVGMTISIY